MTPAEPLPAVSWPSRGSDGCSEPLRDLAPHCRKPGCTSSTEDAWSEQIPYLPGCLERGRSFAPESGALARNWLAGLPWTHAHRRRPGHAPARPAPCRGSRRSGVRGSGGAPPSRRRLPCPLHGPGPLAARLSQRQGRPLGGPSWTASATRLKPRQNLLVAGVRGADPFGVCLAPGVRFLAWPTGWGLATRIRLISR